MMPLRLPLVVLLLAFISASVPAQNSIQPKHYVVIGAFRMLDNAVRFTTMANKKGFTTQYAINPARQLYYVYILDTDEKQKAFNLLIKIKVETNYKDAWVFSGKLGKEDIFKSAPIVEPKLRPVKEPVVAPPPIKDTVRISPPQIDSALIKKPAEIKKTKGLPFYIKVLSKEDGKELFGNLQLQEPGGTQYAAIKSGEIVYMEAPKNKRGTYNVIAQLPGYKQSNLVFPYSNGAAERGSQNEVIITLTLTKSRKGDYVDFNNVHFFKNTSVMQAESQNELDGLVNLLKENLKYKIKIYGHCNGKQARESYTLGTSTKFFAMDPTGNKKETISSKELSLARAETIKSYLVQQGIEAKRISTKGEGGKVPLYPEGGTLGQYNDRVEVEFVKN